MARWKREWWLVAVALCGAAVVARGEYRVVDLGALVNTASGTNASVGAVNAAGQVAMTNAPDGAAYRAYRYSAGLALDLGTLGGTSSFGSGINSNGQAAGRAQTAAGGIQSVV